MSRADRRRGLVEALTERGTSDHYLDAALYDFEYRDRKTDVAWYRSLAREHAGLTDTIVELGAGSGRVTLPLARDGHRVIAIDRSPAMLNCLGQKLTMSSGLSERVTLTERDILDTGLPPGGARMVFAPFNVLMHLYRWQDLLACFREVARILQPDGLFAFDVMVPDLDWLGWDPDVRHAVTRFRHPVSGEKLVYSTNHTYDPATQICHVRIYYDEARPGRFSPPAKPRRLVHLAHRQIFPEELRLLVHTSGLEMVTHDGDFGTAVLRAGIESQTVVCRRPG